VKTPAPEPSSARGEKAQRFSGPFIKAKSRQGKEAYQATTHGRGIEKRGPKGVRKKKKKAQKGRQEKPKEKVQSA